MKLYSYLWLNLNQVETIHIGGITFSGCKLLVRQANNASLVKTSFIDKGGCCYTGVVELSQSSGRLDQCTFINNTGSFSAVVNANGANSNLVISSSSFMDNYYSDRIGGTNGGTIRIQDGQLTIINCSFRASTRGNGGAVHVTGGGDLMIAESYFYNNSAESNGNGGAVYFLGGNITVLHSTFISNMANGGGGGAIYSGKRFTKCFPGK